MRFLKEQDKSTVKEIDKSAKNKWSWKWTTESLSLKLSNNCETHYLLGDCIKKIDEVGVAWYMLKYTRYALCPRFVPSLCALAKRLAALSLKFSAIFSLGSW